MIAVLQLNVLCHFLAVQYLFVVERNAVASPQNIDFLLIGKFPEPACLADSFQDSSGGNQRIFARMYGLTVQIISFATDFLDGDGDQRFYNQLLKGGRDNVLDFDRGFAARVEITNQRHGELDARLLGR